jgi:hypothetical protein
VALKANGPELRRNATKLLQARYGYIDEQKYDLITGSVPDSKKYELYEAIRKQVSNTRSAWIGASSWIQGYVVSEIAWHDFQVLLNNYNRATKILAIPVQNECPAERVARLVLRSEYETALQDHLEHISRILNDRIDELEDGIEKAADKG